MERGGRGRMAGMAGGVLSGAIWGSIMGGLVLLLAALLLDLGSGTPPGAPKADGPPPAPDAGPVAFSGLALSPPSEDLARPPTLPTLAPRTLVPRPARPALPRLAVANGAPVPVADLPPVPERAPVVSPVVSDLRAPTPVGVGDGVFIPAPRADAPPNRVVSEPDLSVTAPPALVLDRPSPPGPLIGASTIPDIAPPPTQGDSVSATLLPDPVSVRSSTPTPAASAAAARRPQVPGPRVAFVLDGAATEPLPGWIGATATATTAGRLALASGGRVVTDPGDGSPDALLAYARLDGPEAADATMLARIALRARRDGAVTVLVAPDPALWSRLGEWLDGPARDLIPVRAASLLE